MAVALHFEAAGWLPEWFVPWGAVVAAYLLGSIPFGWLFGMLKGVDIREHGSKNIGATNAGRVLGRGWGLAAFALDFTKGWLPTAFLFGAVGLDSVNGSPEPSSTWAVAAGAAAVLGHVFPIFLRFKGGKAVATGCGALVGIDFRIFLIGGLAWLVTMALTRFVSLASIVMALAFPCAAFWLSRESNYGLEVVAGASLLTFLILIRHRSNITRLLSGSEPKFGTSKHKTGADAVDGSR